MNIVSDALSWLASFSTTDTHDQSLNDLTVNTLMIKIHSWLVKWAAQSKSWKDIFKDSLLTEYVSVYSVTLVKMNEAFWTRLLGVYNVELQWNCIQTMISDNDALEKNTVKLLYCLIHKLIYFNNSEQGLYLCISISLIKEVFQLTYNKLSHSEYVCMHKHLM